jgi:two-component system cell cycle sensor histidine kinase/response regulator CckA
VITDMYMPKMSCEQLAGDLMKVRKGTPILLCTRRSDTMDEKKAEEIGIRVFALKPLSKRTPARAVHKILEHHHVT